MVNFLIIFTACCLVACNNSVDGESAKTDTPVNIPDTIAGDFHTRETDVIENFFIFINNRDWTTANGFYADTVAISRRSVFFRKILDENNYTRLNLGAMTPLRGEWHAHTSAVSADSARELCFRFRVDSLKIISQEIAPCIQ